MLLPAEIMMLTPELAREYATLTERSLLRDLEELRQMEVVTEDKGRYGLNLILLGSQMPRHRQSATPAA